MIKYHKRENGDTIAEVLTDSGIISSTSALLDFMADTGYHGSSAMIIHKSSLTDDFFNLSTGMAGEMLQKFSNYRMKLAIIGDFSSVKSKSLTDFIRESNQRGTINFVETIEDAIAILGR